MATTKVATRAAVRLAGSWRADLRDVRCKMYDVRGLTGVGSLLIEGTMGKNKFGSLDVGLIDLDEIKKLKKEDVMAMLKQAEHLQWKGQKEL